MLEREDRFRKSHRLSQSFARSLIDGESCLELLSFLRRKFSCGETVGEPEEFVVGLVHNYRC